MIVVRNKRTSGTERRTYSMSAVMDCAQRLFVSQGYHGTPVEQIAQCAGLTKAAVFFYFVDKQSLLNAVLERVEEQVYRPLFEELAQTETSASERLVTFLHRQAVVGAEDADMLLLPVTISKEFSGSDNPAGQRVRKLYDQKYAAIEQVVADGQRSGEFSQHASAAALASVIVAIHDGMLLEWLRQGRHGEIDGQALVRAMRLIVLHGLMDQTATHGQSCNMDPPERSSKDVDVGGIEPRAEE